MRVNMCAGENMDNVAVKGNLFLQLIKDNSITK